MTSGMSYKSKQFFFVLIKLGIVVGAFFFICQKLTNNEHLSFLDFCQILSKNNVFSLKHVVFLTFLTIFNWFFEILKWQKLCSLEASISLKKSMEQCLGALTASLFTPNRIGEYGAKAVYFPKPYRRKIVLLNLLGNITQMSVTTIFGIIGLFAFYFLHEPLLNLKLVYLIFGVSFVIIAVGTFLFLSKSFKVKGLLLSKIIGYVKNIPLHIKFQILLFSVLRYLAFSFQFFYLLHLFGCHLNYLEAMTIITSMYLLASIIPSLFIFDVVVKGGVAVYLFSFAGVDSLIILAIATCMWLLNFVLPSIFGSYHVLNFNLPKTE